MTNEAPEAVDLTEEGVGNDAPDGSVSYELMELHRQLDRLDKALYELTERTSGIRVERDAPEDAMVALARPLPQRSPVAQLIYEHRSRTASYARVVENLAREVHL